MNNLKFTTAVFFILVSISLAQPLRYSADYLDFSRFPLCDVYFTYQSNDPRSIPSLENISKFEIGHNGKSVTITDIQSVIELKKLGETELYIALVLDNSASMDGREKFIENALNQFIDSLRTGDLAAIFNFGTDGTKFSPTGLNRVLHAKKLIQFSNSKSILKKYTAYKNLVSNTFIYDAMYLAVHELNKTDVLGRKVIILFSDGADLGSDVDVDEVIQAAKFSNIPVFCIDLNVRENDGLKAITKSTGGAYFFVENPSDLNNLYQSVLSTLKSQYRITYNSPSERLLDSIYTIRLQHTLGGKPTGTTGIFEVSYEKQAFYSLVYLDKSGKSAVDDYTDFLSAYPDSKFTDNVLFLLGRYWKVRGEYNKSLKVFDKILRNRFSAFYNPAQLEKADIFNLANSFRDAQLIYTDLLKSNVDADIKSQAMINLANSYQNEGNLALALQTYLNVTKDFEGTEDAAFSLYQAALIAVKTDSSELAKQNLQKIINEYPESKVAEFAKSALAEILLREGSFDEAFKLLTGIIQTAKDADFLFQNKLLLAELLEKSSKFSDAAKLLTELNSETISQQMKNEFNSRIAENLYKAGNYDQASAFFNGLSPEEQVAVMSRLKSVGISIDGKQFSGNPDGSLVLMKEGGNSSVRLIPEKRPELTDNFPVDGQIYRIEKNEGENTFILPVTKPGKLAAGAGVYYYNNNKWDSVQVQRYFSPGRYEFRTAENGLFAVLSQKPRVITLFNIYFDFGLSTIKKEAETNLYVLTDELKELPFYDVEIHGHTDSVGTEEENLNLSLERANSVRKFLILNGIDSVRIQSKGFGEALPIAGNDNDVNMAKNRRTEFIFKTKQSGGETLQSGKVRYTVIYKTYLSAKDAYDDKRFLQKQGYSPYVLIDPEPQGSTYKIVLGSFTSYQSADDFIKAFTYEFKDARPVINEEKL